MDLFVLMEAYSVKLFGDNIISFLKHHIMVLSYDNKIDNNIDLIMESVTYCSENRKKIM